MHPTSQALRHSSQQPDKFRNDKRSTETCKTLQFKASGSGFELRKFQNVPEVACSLYNDCRSSPNMITYRLLVVMRQDPKGSSKPPRSRTGGSWLSPSRWKSCSWPCPCCDYPHCGHASAAERPPPCSHACMYLCMYVGMYVCMYVCTYVCMYVRMYACMHVCMYACMYVCMYV